MFFILCVCVCVRANVLFPQSIMTDVSMYLDMSQDVNIQGHHSLPICTEPTVANVSYLSPPASHTSTLDPRVRLGKEVSFIIDASEGVGRREFS